MTEAELKARLAEIDATMKIPVTITGARDLLQELGTNIGAAEWFKCAIAAAWVIPEPEPAPPPWFVPTPKRMVQRHTYTPEHRRRSMFEGMKIPDTFEGAAALYGCLTIFTDWGNWYRCAIIHTFVTTDAHQVKMAYQTTARELGSWNIAGLPGSGNVTALFNTWHKAIMAGKATPLRPGDLFVLPEMAWPHKIKAPPKKPLTAKQKAAKLQYEISQYRKVQK